jgi:hypothetical protein
LPEGPNGGKGDWQVGLGIVLAGRIRLLEAAPLLVGLIERDWDWSNEEIATALERMNDAGVVRHVIERYPDLEWFERNYLSGVMENSRFPELESSVLALLETESDGMFRVNLGMALATYGSAESLAAARRVLAENPEDPENFEIAGVCYAFALLGGASADEPELAAWRTRMEVFRERRGNFEPALKRLQELGGLGGGEDGVFGGEDREGWEPPLRSEPRLPRVAAVVPGRNEPCPCGSGKKYKKCCLGKVG